MYKLDIRNVPCNSLTPEQSCLSLQPSISSLSQLCVSRTIPGYRVLYSTGRCYVATHVLQIVLVSEGRSDNQVHFCASLHSHTTWGGDTPGGWGRTRGLGPPAAPPGTRGGPAVDPARAPP